MLIYPQLDPVAFHIGPLAVHWYGLMYLFGFIIGWGLLLYRVKKGNYTDITPDQLSDLIFYIALGVIVGGRLGYMLFYDFGDFIHHPWILVMTWKGGMSFHGGAIGVTLAMWLWGRKHNKTLGEVSDFVVPAIPLGLGLGRIGNFINGELWGRVTDVPWGMIFPGAGNLPRHPSQLYEAFLEGLVMFLILWIYSSKRRPPWAVSGLFLILYGVFRIIVEFFREPDVQIGYLFFGITEGQLLSIPMIGFGLLMMYWACRHKRKQLCSNT